MPLLPRLLKTFYRTGLNCLPVVAASARQDASVLSDDLELVGFALRSELDQFMADLDRARGDFDEIPAEILVRDRVPSEAMPGLQNRAEIPVIDLRGEQLANWSEAGFLKALAAFRESRGVPAPEDAKATSAGGRRALADGRGARNAPMTFTARADAGGKAAGRGAADSSESFETIRGSGDGAGASGANRWLGEILLAAMPYALFATDLQGNTLFYNSRFEEAILTKRVLKNSIRLAETFLLELTRTLLARSFEEDPLRKQRNALTTYHEDLDVRVRVQNLEQDGRIQGYLYIFLEPGAGELFHELADRIGRGQGLEDVMDDVEGRFIYLMLERHGQNVSHTARALKIKRSTLQNKIKRLRLDERYNRRIEGPVRRHRRTVAEILAARAREEQAGESPPAGAARRSTKSAAAATRSAKATAKKAAKSGSKKSAKPAKSAKSNSAKKSVSKKTAGKQSAKKKTAAKKTSNPKAARKKASAATPAGKKAAASKTAGKKSTNKRSAKKKK